MHGKILLAGGTWRPRALVLAQLEEDGCDVTAVETWDEAELLLRKGAIRPSVVILDLDGEERPDVALSTLARLSDPGRALILTASSAYGPEKVRSHGFPNVMARPYSVGDVVEAVAALAGGRTT